MLFSETLQMELNDSLDKFQDFYESEHNIKLPKMRVREVILHLDVSRAMRGVRDLSYLSIEVDIEKKDGRMGKVNKFFKEYLEMILDVTGVGYSEITPYISFTTNNNL